MNCIACASKKCRAALSCGAESFDLGSAKARYHRDYEQHMVQAAARLVDNGRAGNLSRIQELIEFIKQMRYKKVGLAYCYGMESLAKQVLLLLRDKGIPTIGVSCTVGGVSQSVVNEQSDLVGVSCNPINQALQLEEEGVDLAVVIGLCLGHDILFNRTFTHDTTTLVVKDRLFEHAPVKGIMQLCEKPRISGG